MAFMFDIGEKYTTQLGNAVLVIGRTIECRGYECLECSDGKYRYDRSDNGSDAGHVTASAHDYSDPDNFVRADKPFSNL